MKPKKDTTVIGGAVGLVVLALIWLGATAFVGLTCKATYYAFLLGWRAV